MEGLTLHARLAGEDFGIDSASSPHTQLVCAYFPNIQPFKKRVQDLVSTLQGAHFQC